MKTTPQFDLHPDAESLNAFVEQALPERERGQVVAHLAECGRCRQVVFLAQELAETAATSVAARPAGNKSRARFWGWRFAWVPAVALAAIAGVVVVIQVRHIGPVPDSGQEVAKVAPPQELQTKKDDVVENGPEASAVSPAFKRPFEKKMLPITPRMTASTPLNQALPAAAPPVAFDAAVASHDELNGTLGQPGAGAQGYMAQAPTVHGPSTQSQQEWHGSQQAAPYPPAPIASAPGTLITGADVEQPKADTAVAGRQSSAARPMIAKEPRPGPSGVSTEDFAGERKQAATAGFSMKAARLKLPSGLSIGSIAMGMHRTLAIDSAGAVFLSMDGGMNWEPVTRPWTGHPVLVRFREASPASNEGLAKQAIGGPANATNASNGVSGGAIAGTLMPTGNFEVVTDSGQVWTSADGEDWKKN